MSVKETLAGSPDVRRRNLAVLLRHLHVDGPMRRAELTKRTGLTRSTVAGLVGELVRMGAVEQSAARATVVSAGRGRPSPLVRPCPLGVQVLAAEVRVDQVEVALVGLGGTVLHRDSRPLPDRDPAAAADLIAGMVAPLAARTSGRVLGLGVAMPGVTRHEDGAVRFAPNLQWRDVAFGALLAVRLPRTQVQVVNDGDAGALAEHLRGVARGSKHVVFVDGEVGVGSGVIIDGRPLTGAGGYAGELGHMKVAGSAGRQCRCGSLGCWETEIGRDAIAEALGLTGDVPRAALVERLRSAGPREVEQLVPVARRLGAGLATIVNLFNPELVVLGGLLREIHPLVADHVHETLLADALGAPVEQVRLTIPELGDDAVLLGASETVWQRVLLDPASALAP